MTRPAMADGRVQRKRRRVAASGRTDNSVYASVCARVCLRLSLHRSVSACVCALCVRVSVCSSVSVTHRRLTSILSAHTPPHTPSPAQTHRWPRSPRASRCSAQPMHPVTSSWSSGGSQGTTPSSAYLIEVQLRAELQRLRDHLFQNLKWDSSLV